MTAASANPLLPNLTQPVFPESLTATINALSPFLNAPMGLTYGLSSGFDTKKGKIRSYHLTSLIWVFGLGRFRRSYCGPTLFIGPTGSSGNVSNISLSWWIVGIGTVLPLFCQVVIDVRKVKGHTRSLQRCNLVFVGVDLDHYLSPIWLYSMELLVSRYGRMGYMGCGSGNRIWTRKVVDLAEGVVVAHDRLVLSSGVKRSILYVS
jgi:hypothetical protein